MGKRTTIGPWAGIDNVHRLSARAFQIPNWKEKGYASVSTAKDVDINDDGWMISRKPLADDKLLTAGLGGWEVADRFFFQDGTTLYEYGVGAPVERLVDLNKRVDMCAHGGLIYITDGVNHWELDGSQVRTWGQAVPELVVGASTGSLDPGTYLVQASFTDARGNEGGMSVMYPVSLPSGGGIFVDLTPASDQHTLNIYIGSANQTHTTYVTSVDTSTLPYVFEGVLTTALDPPKTEQMIGPIADAAGLFSYRAFLFMWRDNVLFRSEGTEPHLFHPDNIMQFDGDVQACVGLKHGAWVGTTTGLWWISGEDSDAWTPLRKTPDLVVKGSGLIPGAKLPTMETDEPVALFLTSKGLIAGASNGRAVHLLEGVYEFTSATRVSFAYTEHTGIYQVLMSLED